MNGLCDISLYPLFKEISLRKEDSVIGLLAQCTIKIRWINKRKTSIESTKIISPCIAVTKNHKICLKSSLK